ncbi:MAG: hypothetical protein ACOYMB_04420 [Patescibacteria group bacterium]
MEEKTKDTCYAGGKCTCHKKWLKIAMAMAIALVVFLVGVSVGAHFSDRSGGRYLNQKNANNFNREGSGQCGASVDSCPMMQGGGRGEGIKRNIPVGVPETQLPEVDGSVPVATTTINQ